MSDIISMAANWPPFPLEQLPAEIWSLMEDFGWAGIRPHPHTNSPILTVLVPCFNPNPEAFCQMLLSVQQQSNQNFNLLVVNDGSSDEAWTPIKSMLENLPWIEVIHQSSNQGISAAINTGVAHISTPYVSVVDQDDLLHPAAVDLVLVHLESHPGCGLLYSDHVTFNDTGDSCRYVPKFPWNPEALLEFNFLIHLTVLRVELYRACGGMDSNFDGIQDWEFYLRLAPLLQAETVGYLPVPLYAWRLSSSSVASSAQPRARLLKQARAFLHTAHRRWESSSRTASDSATALHYRLQIDRSAQDGTTPLACTVLVLAGKEDKDLIINTLMHLSQCGLQIRQVFIAQDPDSPPILISTKVWPEPEKINTLSIRGKLHDLADQLPSEGPLLTLQAGVLPEADSTWKHLPAWLEQNKSWDLLTLPGYNQKGNRCISAGYCRGFADQEAWLPVAAGLTRQEYEEDFNSFSHTRAVDLPSPTIQLLRTSCLKETLRACLHQDEPISQGWWPLLSELGWRCCCLPEPAVTLMSSCQKAEQAHIAVREGNHISLRSSERWLGSQQQLWQESYLTILQHRLKTGPARMHPLHVQLLREAGLHPAIRHAAEQRQGRVTLLPPTQQRPLVILIPTELNVRSNGHACMLTLALQLHQAGRPVYLLPFKPHTFFSQYLTNLPRKYRDLPFISDPLQAPEAVLLVPESAPRRLVQKLRTYYKEILWWLLAPPGLLTPFWPDIRIGDLLVAFSEFTLPNQRKYLFIHPKPHKFLEKAERTHAPQTGKKLQIALYTGKGRSKALPRELHRQLLAYKVVLITRSFPQTKKSLMRLLSNSKGLISWDPMTNLFLEAANLGVPTLLAGGNPFSDHAFQNFPVNLHDFVTDSSEQFIALLKNQGPVHKLSSSLLHQKNSEAVPMIDLFTFDPEPVASRLYRVDNNTLLQLKRYRQKLIQSKTIQTERDGQSLSSAFSNHYVRSLKSPYWRHAALCRALVILDISGDTLVSIGLFRPLRLMINKIKKLIVR